MRKTVLTKSDKEEMEKLLTKLELIPPMAGQVVFNIDGNGKVSSAELAKVVWR